MSNKFAKPLLFLGIMPDEPLRGKIQELKQYMKKTYHSSHSLNAPPHITLLSPFRTETNKIGELQALVKVFAQSFDPFEIHLQSFSTFPPKVIFIDVEQAPSLMKLQEKLETLARNNEDIFNYSYDDRPYHPHLTLAFKDLSKKNFHRAWKEFKEREFEESFTAEQLSLFQHNGERWVVEEEFELEKV